MTIAITGSTGFLGAVLIPMLLEQGHQLRLLTRKKTEAVPGVVFVYGELLDTLVLDELVKGADVTIHMAAMISVSDRPEKELFHVNTESTRLLIAASRAAGVKRFIFVSSITAYCQAPYDEVLDELRGPSDNLPFGYDHSKAVAQEMALQNNQDGLEVLVLAPTAVAGPYDHRPSLIGKAVLNMYRGKIPALFPGGVDFVDVRDVSDAIVQALTKGTPGEAYILSGEWLTLSALAAHIGNIRGKRISLPVLPVWLIMGALPFVNVWAGLTGGAPYYTRQSVYNLIRSNRKISNNKARTALQFRPRPVSVTLADTIQWFKQTGKLS
ncbi:NAD-dependent epimerase/dehydratase family protein [Chitinophaga sp. Mgbs1]|uniref:NAD-dependent epimerase/dehydratase family protein n=1 Tax=Chitinophaga solisilvae TaxID=1233460 RepID=A0A433WEK2_9BACT|nr:NAD-dependent epimerase/dehydratase family protein [Chitinophaga solisilvae]